jgi:glycosyltransferase involved in cell wall biosynthesis
MPQALVLYQFFYPDDVVSSRHFTDLAVGLAERGWKVVAKPSNRSCRDANCKYARFDKARGVRIDRIQRPGFRQARPLGRVLNAVWMLAAWSLAAVRTPAADLLIVGTDPILSVLVAIPWKIIRPRTKIMHWCFDLYPEAAIADGTLRNSGPVRAVLYILLRSAYGCCDVIADIGPCMRKLIANYGSAARCLTVTPWALTEPMTKLRPDRLERQTVFGDASLGLMYSGNFGRAHSFDEVLSLARALRGKSVRFAFSVRGNRTEELRHAVSEHDHNVSFVPFAEESRLDARLSAADIHIVTLRSEWTGSVVPSKFFGALAAGRPVLFIGSQESSIASWIKMYGVGWVLEANNQSQIVAELDHFANRPEELAGLFERCHRVYQKHFSRSHVIGRLEGQMRDLVTGQDTDFHRTPAEAVA